MSTIFQKMRLKAPHIICTLNAPDDFVAALGRLPAGIVVHTDSKKKFDSLHWFVKTQADVDRETARVIKLLKPGVRVWCYYPKGSSKMQTNLTRDKGWDTLLNHDIKWLNLISFNATWSAFCFRMKTEKDEPAESKPKDRPIFKYADSTTKTITLPEDMALAFEKNKKVKALFDSLAFSHRREYVEWVVTAKRDETRVARIDGTIKKILQGLKNPAGRS